MRLNEGRRRESSLMRDSFSHMPSLSFAVVALRACLQGCLAYAKCEAMDMSSDFVMKTMDTDKSLSIESEEVDNSTLDFKPVRTLELCVKSASKITKPACLFIADAEILLKRRTLERSLIEGVKERDSSTLKTALAEIATSPDGYGVAPELHNPAKEIIAMLEIEDELV